MDLAVATYPGRYCAYAMYPPKLFETYMRRLGINSGDQLILYGRDALHGMLYPSTTAWMLKVCISVYGMVRKLESFTCLGANASTGAKSFPFVIPALELGVYSLN